MDDRYPTENASWAKWKGLSQEPGLKSFECPFIALLGMKSNL